MEEIFRMRAIGNYVILEPITLNDLANEAVKEKIEGFEIQRKYQGPPNQGIIRFIGANIKNPEYKEGDRVIFNEPHPDGFKIDNESFIPVKHESIIGKVIES